MDGNRVGVALVSTVTVDGEVPGMKVGEKTNLPAPMATAQQLVLVSCEDRKKKKHNKVPYSPGERQFDVASEIKRQGKTKARSRTCTNTQPSHTHTSSHAPLHTATAPPAPVLSCSPAKTSTTRETCLETEGKLPPCPDWLSSLATVYV